MSAEQREINRRLRILEHGANNGNVCKTCRYFGIGRATFYRWKRKHDLEGVEGLAPKPPIGKKWPNQLPDEVVEKILHLVRKFRSEISGIFVSALLFGVAHGPGLFLRGAGAMGGSLGESPSLWMVVAYWVAILSVAGIFLGIVWARTRNLLLLMIIHAVGDLLPNYAQMVEMVSG